MIRMHPNNKFMDLMEYIPKDIIMAEIGCYAGESTVMFMQKAKLLYAIDPWQAGYDHSDPASGSDFEVVEDAFDRNTRGLNIVKLKGTMLEAVEVLPELDMVYIDGCHKYSYVRNDIALSLQVVRSGGIIAGHDYQHGPVVIAVQRLLGEPDKIFPDNSWLKHIK